MLFYLKKIFFLTTLNTVLFFFMVICIQNSQFKSKVDLLVDKTIDLPNSFILGTSFIAGSFIGGLMPIKYRN
tara:strand:+ start:1407 stop:1622 length:216 start_codon:yes stop_codon:yes gene_type:complete